MRKNISVSVGVLFCFYSRRKTREGTEDGIVECLDFRSVMSTIFGAKREFWFYHQNLIIPSCSLSVRADNLRVLLGITLFPTQSGGKQ